ncbi:MAG: LamG domain-containing protein, partial [Halobacteriovoraceae bacterium]|nr:LamG domain-containing protein [Halobacteriovoraceae bacterium]
MIDFSNDQDDDASAILFFCNETDTPSCDPLTGTSVPLTKGAGEFTGSVTGLTSPNDNGDILNYIVVISDGDGVVGAPSVSQVSIFSLQKIYRSYGAANGSALANGTGNDLIISAGVANFSVALSDIIGIGDAIEYDSDNNGSVDAIAFIHSRTDNQNYAVRKADGSIPSDLTLADQDWTAYRAYTSMEGAMNGDENSSIAVAVRNFDTFVNGKDLTTNNEQWNLVIYADGIEDISNLQVDGWVTSVTNYLKIYAPILPSEVGIRQAHRGAKNNQKAMFMATTDSAFEISVNHIRFAGLQIVGSNMLTSESAIEVGNPSTLSADAEVYLSEMFFMHQGTHVGVVGHAALRVMNVDVGTKVFLNNNIISWTTSTGGINGECVRVEGGQMIAYNNTFNSCSRGLYAMAGSIIKAKNNIAMNSGDWAYDTSTGSFHTDSNNNISDDTSTTGGLNDVQNASVEFINAANHDFRLHAREDTARGVGLDLSADTDLAFTTDIQGKTRSTWDIGASIIAKPIYRSVGYGNTSSIAQGSTYGFMSISSNSLAFVGTTPGNIGVGDAIVYDSNNDTNQNAIAFIVERVDEYNFIVKNAQGGSALNTIAIDNDWQIFRAYTDLDIDGGAENTGIPLALRDFDSGAKDLVAVNEQWNIAFYADAIHNDPTVVSGWTTSETNYMHFFVPDKETEVGVSQRHHGIWDNSKATLIAADANVFNSAVNYIRVEGFQVHALNSTTFSRGIHFSNMSGGVNIIADSNIVKGTHQAISTGSHFGIGTTSSGGVTTGFASFTNNIVYGFNSGGVNNVCFYPTYLGLAHFNIFNNTCVGASLGVEDDGWGSVTAITTIKNNIIEAVTTNASGVSIDSVNSGSNILSDTNTFNVGDMQSTTAQFYNGVAKDYRVLSSDTNVIDSADNLADNLSYSFNHDITGRIRAGWDIGAFEGAAAADNDIQISKAFVGSITATGFGVFADVIGDNNTNATINLKFCNETDTPGCDPTLIGLSYPLIRSFNTFSTTIGSLTTPNDPGDKLKWIVYGSDVDGISGTPVTGSFVLTNMSSYANVNDLIALWKFDEATGTLIDSSGNGYNGTAVSTPTYNQAGRVGQAMEFSSGADHIAVSEVSVPDQLDFQIGDTISFVTWIYPTELTATNVILEKDQAFYLHTNGDEVSFGYERASDNNWSSYQTSSANLAINNWYHIGITYNYGSASSAKVYINGLESTGSWVVGTGSEPPSVNDNSIKIGASFATDEFEGKIDELSIWGKALTQTEIQQIYLAQNIVISDPDIYRSVGPGNTTSLASGAGNNLTVAGSVATFATGIADNIGIGDAIQYDSDNNGSIDAVMFISARTDSQNFTVQSADGLPVVAMGVGDQDWDVFRAYSSTANAESGAENSGINATVRNFDTWSGGRDLVANNETWNIVLYADDTETIGSPITVSGWTTGEANFINIF